MEIFVMAEIVTPGQVANKDHIVFITVTESSSASCWSTCSPHSNFIYGHMSTMWIMVCCWSQLYVDTYHLCRFAQHWAFTCRETVK